MGMKLRSSNRVIDIIAQQTCKYLQQSSNLLLCHYLREKGLANPLKQNRVADAISRFKVKNHNMDGNGIRTPRALAKEEHRSCHAPAKQWFDRDFEVKMNLSTVLGLQFNPSS